MIMSIPMMALMDPCGLFMKTQHPVYNSLPPFCKLVENAIVNFYEMAPLT